MRGLADRAIDILPSYFKRIHLKNITFISIRRLFRDYKKYKKGKKRFLHIHKFIGQDDPFYVLRESNNKLREAFKNYQKHQGIVLLGKSMMGKTTMVFNKILHNKNTLKHYWIFMPENAEALMDWHRRLPFWIDVRKIIIILDDLNKYITIDQQTFSKILDKFKNRKYILIATCRTGDEWKSIEDKFGEYFPNKIYLENISKQSAEKLSNKVEGADIGRFDGSPGSVVLGIGIQEKKINNLEDKSPYCYSILQAAWICNQLLWFDSYSEKLIQSIIKDVLESRNDYAEYIKCTNKLEDNDLITLNRKGEISIIDAYLDVIFKTLKKHSRNISIKMDKFVENNPEYKSRLADFYNYRIGIALFENGEIDKSIKTLRKAIALKDDNSNAWINLGTALSKKSESVEAIDEAIKAYQKAIKLKKDNPKAWNNLGATLGIKGEFDKAIKAFKKAIALKEDYHRAWANLGTALGEKGEYDEAIMTLRNAIALKKDDPEILYNLGNYLGKNGEYSEAIKTLKKSISLKSDNPNAWISLGTALGENRKYHEAIETLRKAITLEENNPVAWYNLGTYLGKYGENIKAIEALQRSLEIKTENPEAWYNLGTIFCNIKEIAKSIEAFKYAINLKEDYSGAWYNLGVALKIAGNLEESKQAFEKSKELMKKK